MFHVKHFRLPFVGKSYTLDGSALSAVAKKVIADQQEHCRWRQSRPEEKEVVADATIVDGREGDCR